MESADKKMKRILNEQKAILASLNKNRPSTYWYIQDLERRMEELRNDVDKFKEKLEII